MKTSVRVFSSGLAAVVVAALAASYALAGTLDDVRKRGHLQCGINTGLVGFAAPDDKGVWKGFDVDVCRAVAAAVFGDANKVRYTNLTGKTRFTALRSGEIDMLSRNTTWTFSRDVDLQFTFVGVNYYDGQGFMVPKKLNVKSAKDLDGASVCIQTGDHHRAEPRGLLPGQQQEVRAGAHRDQRRSAHELPGRALRRLYHRPFGSCGHPGSAGQPRCARGAARDHLQGAPWSAGAAGRRPVGGHRSLDPQRHDRCGGNGRHLREREEDGGRHQQPGDQPTAGQRGTAGPGDAGPVQGTGR